MAKYLCLDTRDESYRVNPSNIVYFEADGNYTNFVLCNKSRGVLLMNLSQVQEMLTKRLGENAAIFERVGRRFIVNSNYIYHIEVVRQKLSLSDGVNFEYQLPISKDALKKLREKSTFGTSRHTTDSGEGASVGRLVVVSTSMPFQLTAGRNIIGRMATGSVANVQIPCEGRLVSRDHLLIEIENETGKGLVHYVSLNKQQVNPTYVGDVLLEYGNKIVLKHNDIIKLPGMEVRFELPDEEGTELNG